MKYWQSLIDRGNQCFNESNFVQAEYFYSVVYDALAFSYRENPTCLDTLSAWLYACQNLSTLYETINKLNLSLKFLLVPHEYILDILKLKTKNDRVNIVALKGLNITLPAIKMFLEKYPTGKACQIEISSSESLSAQCDITAH